MAAVNPFRKPSYINQEASRLALLRAARQAVLSLIGFVGSEMSVGMQMAGDDGAPGVAEIQKQIHRIAASAGFRNSDPIRHVLLFLAKQAIECPGQTVKEHQIATSALGRPADFDPRVDSTVRVVVTRLRARLAEYYTHEGVHDPILVDIPKGAYLLSFAFRQVSATSDLQIPGIIESTASAPAVQVRPVLWIGGLLILIAVALAAFFAGRVSTVPRKPAALATFWDGFLRTGDPLIVFSNPIFEGTPESGMHLLDPSAFHVDGTNDTFTGTGEVIAVHALTEELASLGHQAQVKRARLFSWDEALANNLIIVGGPAQSSVFLQLPQLEDLVLKAPNQEPYLGEEAVRNVKAAGNREAYYRPSRRRDAAIEYAIVALTPGAFSGHSILIVAGTNTFATQAAARFVCNPTLLSALLRRLEVKLTGEVPRFEALLKVEIRGGAPLEPELLLVYVRRS